MNSIFRVIALMGMIVTLGSCSLSDEDVPAEAISQGIRECNAHPRLVPGTLGTAPAFREIVRYEVRNSYVRSIDGEQFRCYDVAVEGKGYLSGRERDQLVPLQIVKRGNTWYSRLDPERQAEDLPSGSLSENALPVLSENPVQSR